ncbi:MAG: hypothetical protein QOH27_2363 [Mycobacterium sp.]|nr:hypothetical protein [Mycobacterium sp.]
MIHFSHMSHLHPIGQLSTISLNQPIDTSDNINHICITNHKSKLCHFNLNILNYTSCTNCHLLLLHPL